MPHVTNVRIMRFRKVQPEQFGGAGAEVELHATVLEGEDYRDISRGLLFDARAMVYENLGMRLPKEAFDSTAELASFKAAPGEAVTVTPGSTDNVGTEEEAEAAEEAATEPAKKPRGRPRGSKNTAPKKGSKAARAAEEAANEIPGEEDTKPKDQISTNPEDRVDPDAIPGENEADEQAAGAVGMDDGGEKAAESEPEMDGVAFNEYINSSIRGGKLTGLQAKEMMKAMKIARVRDLDTPEKIAEAKMMIDAFIAANGE